MKRLLPNATFIGFTGTPLIRKDKKSTINKFGKFIHTYKFSEAVKDGVVVDLCYELRNVEQFIQNKEKVDKWFETKTEGLNDLAKQKLKQRWTTIQYIADSRERLEEVAKDIIFDFERIPRLREGKGTAILIADSIYDACRYWEIFQLLDFKKCAIISSYTPNVSSIKGEEDGERTRSRKQKTYDVYKKMWNRQKYHKLRSDNENGSHRQCFEDDAIYNFINNPSEMKLLIVVNRLLTGFDAPSATYLYLDKEMRDHGLFQAICRVNRLDKDKDLGYIVDYKNLFESISGAVEDYTTGAFDKFDKEDITGLLKDRLLLARERFENTLKQVKEICNQVKEPKGTLEFLHYFVSDELSIEEYYKETEPRRIEFYNAVSNLVKAYSNIADEMSKAGYTKDQKKKIKAEVKFYNDAKDEVMKSAGDYIELKSYDSSMRYMIDNYINANSAEMQYKLNKSTLLEIIEISGIEEAKEALPEKIRNNPKAVALTVETNIASTIINNRNLNPRYYSKMSELLNELIISKKNKDIAYKEYIQKLVDLANKVKNPEQSGEYPKTMRNIRLKGLYDCMDRDEKDTLFLYNEMNEKIPYDFMDGKMKQREAKQVIMDIVNDKEKAEEIFDLWKNTRGY